MASTDAGLIPLYTTQFSTNLQLLLQQWGSLLRGKVDEGFHVGKMASPINQLGALSLRAPTGRFAPLASEDQDYVRRWVFPLEREMAPRVDSFDQLQTIIDPKSAIVMASANAVGRAWDDAIIASATGPAQVGQDASALTTETFTTASYQVSATFGSNSTASGLTVAKLIEARRILRHFHNDLDRDLPVLVIGSQQESDLLNQVQVVSTEFQDTPVLKDGKIVRFLGFDVVVSERLPQTTVGTTRGAFVAVKSGLYLGMWKEQETRIDRRVDLSGQPWQIYTAVMYGATRTQLGKVVQILCADTTGADITA
jgi:Phage capsid protein